MMKAVTLRYPFAWWLMKSSGTMIDNRRDRTDHRGRIAIHASKNSTEDLVSRLGADTYSKLTFGAVVAVAHLVDCIEYASASPAFKQRFRRARGPWCWVYESVDIAVYPKRMSGALGVWDCDIEEKELFYERK